MKPQITALRDTAGNIVLGELISKADGFIKLRNPATLFIQPTQTGQLNVQLFPMVFGELLTAACRQRGSGWDFSQASYAVATDIEFEDKLIEQYNRIFNPSPIIVPQSSPEVVKLFDD